GTIGGLVDRVTYYAVVNAASANLVGLAATAADATATTPVLIDLQGTTPGSGYRLTRSHFKTGDEVVYDDGTGGSALGGLEQLKNYFVVVDANGDLRLAEIGR